jgi:hypothetical protein
MSTDPMSTERQTGMGQMSLDDTDERSPQTPEELTVQRHLAKALWKLQKGNDLPREPEERKRLWAADKADMKRQARRLARQLQRAGVVITAPGKPAQS